MILLGQVLFCLLALAVYLAIAIYMVLNPTVVGNATSPIAYHITRRSPACVVRVAGCGMLGLIPAGIVGALVGHWWAGASAALLVTVGLYLWLGWWRPLDDEVWD